MECWRHITTIRAKQMPVYFPSAEHNLKDRIDWRYFVLKTMNYTIAIPLQIIHIHCFYVLALVWQKLKSRWS